MKKIFLLIILASIGLHAMALDKSGTITTETWSGSINITGTVTVGDGVILTIDAGTTVLFNSSTSLIITGTGIIHANGTAANKITFTRNGSSTWEHIQFEATSTGSNLTHCNISYGNGVDVTAGATQGGGIYIGGSGITLDNCEISNCNALYGGGVEVDGCNPVISNCRIHDNTNEGIDVYYGNPSILNCVIYKNTSSNLAAGISVSGGDPDVINCTITENTTSSTATRPVAARGGMVVIDSDPHIVNSILWNNRKGTSTGNDYTGSTTNMRRCALVQSIPGQFVLSSTNTATTGPNFIDPATYDYSLKFISICRDSGYTTTSGVTIPTSDILGNPTIGLKDIGAYEVKYSKWTGSTDNSWTTAANWSQNIEPSTGSGDVIIPKGLSTYPVNSANPSFTIGTGKYMILEPGARLTLSSITNNGNLLLKSDASGISSLIINSYSGNDANVELYLTGGPVPDGFRWHLISSPFTSLGVSPISSVTLNLAQWIEGYDRMSLDEGWVAFDGYIYPTGPSTGPMFSNLAPNKGYTYYYASNHSFTLSGQFNNPPQSANITCYDEFLTELYGYNLLGNPYPCGLNWDAIVTVENGYPEQTSKALHYRKDGTHVYYVNGVGSEPGVNGIIPPMQGFFVKTSLPTASINLPSSARVHDNIPSRYKGTKSEVALVRLKINNGALSDYAAVRFDNDAKSGSDYDYDAEKEFFSKVRPSIYTIAEGSNFAINGIPFPSPSVDIPVAVKLISTGNYTIESPELTGLDNFKVKLIDKSSGIETDLRANPVSPFTSTETGVITDRFVLRVSEMTTDIDDPKISDDKKFSIYSANNMVNILNLSNEWDNCTGDIKVLDLSGRVISNKTSVFISKSSIIQVESPVSKGLYIVKIESGAKRFSGKILIH